MLHTIYSNHNVNEFRGTARPVSWIGNWVKVFIAQTGFSEIISCLNTVIQ